MGVTSRELPMFPLGMVVFPHQQLGLYVFEARYQQMLADLGTERRFGTCLIARGSEVGGGDERLSIGTVVEVLAAQPFDDGRTLILIEGVHCCEVTTWLDGRTLSASHGARAALRGLWHRSDAAQVH
jgi:Lon protease-like protein